ncbi:MAG: phosphoethanolamine transferase [Eubacterium sp.]
MKILSLKKIFQILTIFLSFIIGWSLDPLLQNCNGVAYVIKIILNSTLIYLLLEICSRFLLTSIFLGLGLFFLSIVQYIKIAYSYTLSYDLIAALFETTWRESSAFRTFNNISILVLVLLFFTFIIFFLRKKNRITQANTKTILVLVFAFLFVQLTPLCINYFFPQIAFNYTTSDVKEDITRRGLDVKKIGTGINSLYSWPWTSMTLTINSVYKYFLVDKMEDPALLPSKSSESPLISIFFIGESLRSDHSPINGYFRNTMPYLKNEKNAIVFPKVLSYATSTIPCVENILKGHLTNKPGKNYSAFTHIFKKHGFKVFTISDELNGNVFLSYRINKTLQGSIDSQYHNILDIKSLEDQIKIILNDSSPKKLILINTVGSHFPYNWLPSPKIFSPCDFTETKELSHQKNALINAYDNTIIYTDTLWKMIFNLCENSPTLLLYASDHGQSLGENNIFMHGGEMNVEEQRIPFFFIWMSDSYLLNNSTSASILNKNKNKLISHEYIFSSILSMSGIKSEAQEKEFDITNPKCFDLSKHEQKSNLIFDTKSK